MKYRDPITNTFKDLTVKVSDTLPIGTIVGYAGATAPDGWLICDGSVISRSLYSALFSAIGTTYGAGNGSTTFNLPDMSGRVPVGLKVNTEWFASLGQTGGSETHTLTIEEIPSHSHILGYDRNDLFALGTGEKKGEAGRGSSTAGTDWSTFSTGGGQAHNNLQPYMTVNYIMKAYQPIAVPGKIVNNYSTNPDNAYNTIYVNEKNEELFNDVMGIMESAAVGKLLWTNPNPTSNFAPQTLNLDLSNYDEIEIIYRHYKTDATRLSTKTLIPSKQALVYPELDTSGGFIAIQSREFEVKNTGIVFESGYFKGAGNMEQNNGRCVPLYVIGYKTGLFD